MLHQPRCTQFCRLFALLGVLAIAANATAAPAAAPTTAPADSTRSELLRIIRQGPGKPEPWRRLMRLDADAGQYADADAAAQHVLDLAPGDGDALAVRTDSLIHLGRFQEALGAAEDRLKEKPDDWPTQINRIIALHGMNHSGQELLKLAFPFSWKNADEQGANLLQAIALEMAGDPADTKTALLAAAGRPCRDFAVGARLVRELDIYGFHAKSLAVLKQFSDAASIPAREALMTRLWEDGRAAEAVGLFGAATSFPDEAQAIGIYCECLKSNGRSAEVQPLVQLLKSRGADPQAAAWSAIEALTPQSTGVDIRAARDSIAAAVDESGDNANLLYFLGRAHAALGDIPSALDCFRRADALNLTWSAALAAEANLLLETGHIPEAQAAADAASRRSPNSAAIAIVRVLLDWKRIEAGDDSKVPEANRLINAIQAAQPGQEQTLRVRAAIQAKYGLTSQAAQTARTLLNQKPAVSDQTLVELAEISRRYGLGIDADCLSALNRNSTADQRLHAALWLGAQGDVTQAIAILEPLVQADAAAPESERLALVSLYCRAGQYDRAQNLCARLLDHPDEAGLLAAAQVAMFQRHESEATDLLARLDQLPATPGRRLQLRGDFYYIFARYEQAGQCYEKAAAQGNDSNCLLALADCRFLLGQKTQAVEILKRAKEKFPDNQQVASILAQIAAINEAGDGKTDRAILSALVKDPSDSGPPATTLKSIKSLMQSSASEGERLGAFQRLARQLPRFLPAQTALIEAQIRAGRNRPAAETALRAAEDFPDEPYPAQLATDAFCALNDWPASESAAGQWRSRTFSDFLKVDLQIAMIHLHLHDPAAAIAVLQPYFKDAGISPDEKRELLLLESQALSEEGNENEAAAVIWPLVQADPAAQRGWLQIAPALPPARAARWVNRLADFLKTAPHPESVQVGVARAWDALAVQTGDKRYAQAARDLAAKLQAIPAVAAEAALASADFADADGDQPAAAAACERAVSSVDMNHAGVRFQFAEVRLLSARKQYISAIAELYRIVAQDESNPKWRLELASLLAEAQDGDSAAAVLDSLDQMTPGAQSLSAADQIRLAALRRRLLNPSH